MEYDITKLKTSWTKFDIVQTLDLLYDKETLFSYIEASEIGHEKINTPILKAFLGVETLNVENLPFYWTEILRFPKEKKLFGLFSLILTHHEVIDIFKRSSTQNMIGTFTFENTSKMNTNIRSCLVESEAAKPIFRREKQVPYDFSSILVNKDIGKLFKYLLIDRLNKITSQEVNDENYYQLVEELKIYNCFCSDKEIFKIWLENGSFKLSRDANQYPHIKEVKINSFYSIEEEIKLDFENSNEIYFVGENGDGKSLILMAMYLAFNKDYILNHTDQGITGKIRDIFTDNPHCNLYGKDSDRKINKYLNNFFAYGTHRGRFSADNTEKYGFMSLFGADETLISPEKWIKDQLLKETQNEYSNIDYIKEILYDLLDKNVKIHMDVGNLFFYEKGKKLKFDQLSEGFRSITIFIIDLLSRLQKISKNNRDIFSTSAIVVVDEIDLHLHPKWKKTIVSKLRSIFKNIQFIFTTHSPTIIQGASDDAIIFRVFRNEDGITRITDKYYRKDLNNMMLNTLVTSSLFDLESARLDEDNDNADTSDDYLLSKIHKQVRERLENQKIEGKKKFISKEDVDRLIKEVLEEFENDQS